MATISEALAIAIGHHQAGRLQAAEQLYQRILAVQANHAGAWHLLGVIAHQMGRHEVAVQYIQRAIGFEGNVAAFHNNLGETYLALRRMPEAVACFHAALQLNPDFAEAHYNLGNALRDQGKQDQAVACYRRALELKPDYVEPYNNLGNVLNAQGKRDEAVACYRRALELKPDFAEAHWNRALLWLLTGDFAQGWPEYEWRWRRKQAPRRPFPEAPWDGRPLDGKTIVLHTEQGLGDTIQFIRYAALVRQSGARVIVACQKALLPILKSCQGIDLLVPETAPPPAFDAHVPLMSLPGIFKTSLESIPGETPYLFADSELVGKWRERLGEFSGFKIGICWQGNPAYRNDRDRSVPLREFASLARIAGICWISLQKGLGREQLAEVRDRFPVIDLADELDEEAGPFMDTAAVMKNLDLVITVDTAIEHLAGALGVPVWVALPLAPDWRWFLDRVDSPWYPTVRLFRQRERGNWQGLFDEIGKAIRRRLQSPTTDGVT